MCGIATNDPATDAIDATSAWLQTRISSLDSSELRTCALHAFGLHETSQFANAPSRLTAIAKHLGRSVTTARRRAHTAINLIAHTTTRADSIPHQLHQNTARWIDLRYVPDANDNIRNVRCFLIAAIHPMDQPDKTYALVRLETDPDRVAAIPAVRVRHLRPAPPPGNIGRSSASGLPRSQLRH